MRKKTVISITAIAITAILGFFSTHCTKIEPERVMKVSTGPVGEVSQTSCMISGTLIDLGRTSEVSQHGFALSFTTNKDGAFHTQLNKRENVGGFNELIDGLTPGTDYHIWAYASKDDEKVYGDIQKFRTLDEPVETPPELTTIPVEGTTWNSAISGGNITSQGSSEVIERGLVWGPNSEPTKEDLFQTADGGGGEFIVPMTDLIPETQYFVRAYARNSTHLAYGNEHGFSTEPEPPEPNVVTGGVDQTSPDGAQCWGSIDFDGGIPIVSKGFCVSTNPNPTLADIVFEFEGTGSDPYDMYLTGLDHDTEYFFRAYATNSAGKTGYGQQEVFRTEFLCGEILLDSRDMQEYPTISLGEQCWLAQNLRVGEFVQIDAGQSDNGNIERYCYDNNPDNCEAFGGLYTWDEMMQYGTTVNDQGVCPDRWHIPSDGEWMVMERFLGMQPGSIDSLGFYRGYSNEGGLLKAVDPAWEGPNVGAVDPYGFSALPSGMIYHDGSYGGLGDFTVYWTSTLVDEASAIYRMLHTSTNKIGRFVGDPAHTTTVRCVKD